MILKEFYFMKIQNVNVLVTKVEMKQGKNSSYLAIDFIDMSTGQLFTVIDKEIDRIQQLRNMTKYIFNLSISSSKYGIQLSIDNIVKELGGI